MSRRACLLGLVALAAAGAPVRNTPAQDLAWERWARCRPAASFGDVLGIDTDGRIRFQVVSGYDRDRLLACLAAEQAAGPPLPAPVPVIRPVGP
jgi:hypothetical protein